MSQQINLFNPIFRKQKKYFSAMTMAQALGMILLGSLLVAGFAGFRITGLNAQADGVNRQLLMVEGQLAQVTVEYAPRQKSNALETEMQQIESELKSLQKISETLNQGALGNTLGYARYLQAFARQIIQGVWLTGFSIQGAGAQIGLQGRALTPELVPAYIRRLKNEPVMHGKSFSTLEMQVPQVVPAVQGDPSVKSVATAPYIEFSLHSTGSPRQPENGGGTNK